MPRRPIPKSECRLLSRSDARRYCGGLGDERFDREVAPTCAPRFIGHERFYDRCGLDAWVEQLPVDRLGTSPQRVEVEIDWQKRLRDDLHKNPRDQHRSGP